MSDPSTVFSDLLAKTPTQPGRAYRLFAGPDGVQLQAFVDGISRMPGLSIRIAKPLVKETLNLPKMRGAEFKEEPYRAAQDSHGIAYELTAAQKAYVDVFVELASRLIIEATSAGTGTEAILRIAKRIAAWARFFDSRGENGLGRSAQLGLLGELLCLHKLGNLIGFQRSIGSWTGPKGTIHDFQNESGALEVKLTTSHAPERLRISSERQLDESSHAWLGMFAVLAQEASDGPTGLSDLVDHIRTEISELDPASSGLFEELLIESGYADADREHYGVRLIIHAQHFLQVDGDFPRILPSELRPGVFDVGYDVAWSSLLPYSVTDDLVRRVLGVTD